MKNGVFVMTTYDPSGVPQNENGQLPEVIPNLQRPANQSQQQPRRNKVGGNPIKSTADQKAIQSPAPVPPKEQKSCDEPLNRHPQGNFLFTVLAVVVGIGIFWCFQNLGPIVGPVSDSGPRRTVERRGNNSETDLSTEKSRQEAKGAIPPPQVAQNVVVSEKAVVESRPFLAPVTPNIDQIPDRMLRLDDEFSRLKIDIADWKKTDELRRQSAARNSALARAILSGGLLLRTSSDERIKTNIPLVFVPAGQFIMGQTTAQRGESARASLAGHFDFSHPAFPVQVKSGFFIGTYEVTVGQIQEFAAQNAVPGTATASTRNEAYLHKPASNIDWSTAVAFCQWLSKINGVPVRLPTEFEWEYAARGNSFVQSVEGLREKENVVGGPWSVDYPSLDRSWCGCVAMNSNVQEWTMDVWEEKLYGTREAGLKASGPNASFVYLGPESEAIYPSLEPRAVRGSSFQDIPANRVLAIRRFKPVDAREPTLGFRIVVPVFVQ